MNTSPGRPLAFDEVAELLTEARARTIHLVAPLSDDDLTRQHNPLMSPIVWDLGHIAHFEEVWLIESLRGGLGGSEGLRGMYNPFENPRKMRNTLELPSIHDCMDYMAGIRRVVLDELSQMDFEADAPLLRDGFVFRLVLQHEYQHNETMLQTLQLKEGEAYRALRAFHPPTSTCRFDEDSMVQVAGGRYPVGTPDRSAAYDNERPVHTAELTPFSIDATAVTNRAFLHFVDEGGYGREEFWSAEGSAWLRETGARCPKYWELHGTTWHTRSMDRVHELAPDTPVCHVTYWEAEAYARFVGKRLPTEFEWEVAASWDPASSRMLAFPWGERPPSSALANLDSLSFGTARIGAYAENVSPLGCYGMIGDVWEWTSSDFMGYPGFEMFPYPEYSEVFFGSEYKVLRGGSWATRPGAIRNTFRNWDYPIRRQIFSGFRCARDDN